MGCGMRGLVLAAAVAVAAGRDTSCAKSRLPYDFDLIGNVERVQKREVHLTGEYRLGADGKGDILMADGHTHHNVSIDPSEDGMLRVSVQPGHAMMMHIDLIEDDYVKHQVERHTLEHHLQAILVGGRSYKLRFKYAVHHQDDILTECPTTFLEMAFAENTVLEKLVDVAGDVCDRTDLISGKRDKVDLDIIRMIEKHYPQYMDDDQELLTNEYMNKLRFQYSYTGHKKVQEGENLPSFLSLGGLTTGHALPITLPHLRGSQSTWLLKLSIYTEFLFGGGLTAFITPYNFELNGDWCPEGVDFEECVEKEHGIVVAAGERGRWKNTYTLTAALNSRQAVHGVEEAPTNKYKLWLYNRGQTLPTAFDEKCFFYNVRIKLSPVQEEEDPINCRTIALPPNLNEAPGYYDDLSNSLLVYQDVAVDMDTGVVATTLMPREDSLLRLYTEHPSMAMQVVLQKTGVYGFLATSALNEDEEIGIPQGLAFNLEAGVNYTIFFAIDTVVPPEAYTSGWDNEWHPWCESFLVRIEMTPHGTRPNQPEKRPDFNFSSLATYPHVYQFFSIPGERQRDWDKDVLYFSFSHRLTAPYWQQETIGVWNFTLVEPSVLSLAIFRDFMLGDVVAEVQEIAHVDGVSMVLEKTLSHNELITTTLDAKLQAGNYSLILKTSYAASYNMAPEDEAIGPPTVEYSLDLVIESYEALRKNKKGWRKKDDDDMELEYESAICGRGHRPMPAYLSLSHHPHFHMFDQYVVPKSLNHDIYFTPATDVVLHVQIVDSKAAVGLVLEEADGDEWKVYTPEASEAKEEEEEEKEEEEEAEREGNDTPPSHIEELYEGLPWLMANLDIAKRYRLRFKFEASEDGKRARRCSTFTLQLSTGPTSDLAGGKSCEEERLPPVDLFKNLKMPFEHRQVYVESGKDVMEHKHLNFTLEQETELRVLVQYDFRYQHVYVDICKCSNADFTRCWECGDIRGTGVFNGEEIATQRLAAGSYIMKVYESIITQNIARQECEKFALHIWMDTLGRSSDMRSPGHNCSHNYLPPTLNLPGMYFANDVEFHTLGEVRLDASTGLDSTLLEVKHKGVLRLWAPHASKFPDWELYQYIERIPTDDEGNPMGEAETVAVETVGNTVEAVVAPGTYRISVIFHFLGAVMPDEDGKIHTDHSGGYECESTPLEISFIPVSVMQEENMGTRCLPFEEFPTELNGARPIHGHTIRQRPAGEKFEHIIPMRLGARGAEVVVDLRSTFETGSLHFYIRKRDPEEEDPYNWRKYNPQRYLDRDYFAEVLPEGEYEIVFTNTSSELLFADANNTAPANLLARCQQYSLHARVHDSKDVDGGDAPTTPQPTLAPGDTPRPATPAPVADGIDCPQPAEFPQDMQISERATMRVMHGEGYTFLTTDDESLSTLEVHVDADSLTRLYTYTGNDGVDIDIAVYDADQNPVTATRAVTPNVDTLLLSTDVDAAGQYRVMIVVPNEERRRRYTYPDDYENCQQKRDLTTFDFAMGSMTLAQIQEATSDCSGTKWPSRPFSFAVTSEGLEMRRRVYIDKEVYLSTLNGVRETEFTVKPHLVASIYIELKYDFILQNIQMTLRNNTDEGGSFVRALAVGVPSLMLGEDGAVQAVTRIVFTDLAPGKYVIETRNLDAGHQIDQLANLASLCLPIDINVQAVAWADGTEEREDPKLIALSPESDERLAPYVAMEVEMTFSEPVNGDESVLTDGAVVLRCECMDDAPEGLCVPPADGDERATSAYSLHMENVMERDEGRTLVFQFHESETHPLRWASVCRLAVRREQFVGRDSGKPMDFSSAPCDDITDVVSPPPRGASSGPQPCIYHTARGECDADSRCRAGGQCPVTDVAKPCHVCQRVRDDQPAPWPVGGICPEHLAETAQPESTPLPLMTHEPTTAPTPHPPLAPIRTAAPGHTLVPMTFAPPTGVPRTSTPPTPSRPTPPTPSRRPMPPPPTPWGVHTGTPTVDTTPTTNTGGGGGPGRTVIVILVVLALAGGGFFAWKKGWIVKREYRPTYQQQLEMEGDDDDNDDQLFDDNDDDDEDAQDRQVDV